MRFYICFLGGRGVKYINYGSIKNETDTELFIIVLSIFLVSFLVL